MPAAFRLAVLLCLTVLNSLLQLAAPAHASAPEKSAAVRKQSSAKARGKAGSAKMPVRTSSAGVPIVGAGEANEALDNALLAHLERSKCTAGTLAISRGDRIIYARGYGWLDLAKTTPTPPDTPMRVASISKPITAAAIHKLISNDKLTEATKIFPLLKLKLPAGGELDGRWRDVTVGQLLDHKGGWDIQQLGFDPMFSAPRAANELKLEGAATAEDIIRWMMTKPLSFDPGERSAYSNFGYNVLGRVIERVSRKPYITYLRQEILKPAGINPKEMWLGQTDPDQRNPREPQYNQPCNVDVMDAHGGIVVASPVLCEYLEHYWISGRPRAAGAKGQVWTFYGSMPGTSAIAHQRADGINFACGFNGRHGDASLDALTTELNRHIDASK